MRFFINAQVIPALAKALNEVDNEADFELQCKAYSLKHGPSDWGAVQDKLAK
jgi:hypothetical protein